MFCNCNAGFHKKPWEGALGQKIRVDVLEVGLGDLDGDGDLDVIVGRFRGGAETWFNQTRRM